MTPMQKIKIKNQLQDKYKDTVIRWHFYIYMSVKDREG